MSGIFAPKDAEGIAPFVDLQEAARERRETAAEQPEAKPEIPQGLNLGEILARIDAVIRDTQYIKELFANLGSHHGDEAGTMAVGMGNAVQAREHTNQKVLGLLERMYDDLAGKGER